MIDSSAPLFHNWQLKYNFNLIDTLLISHIHRDHCDLKNIETLIFRYSLKRIICNNEVANYLKQHLSLLTCQLIALSPNESVTVNDLRIKAFSVPHDATNNGYVIWSQGKKVVYITDCGHIPEWFYSDPDLKNADLLMIEANYHEEYANSHDDLVQYDVKRRTLSAIGHLSFEDAEKYVKFNESKNIVFLHYSLKQSTEILRYELLKRVKSSSWAGNGVVLQWPAVTKE